MKNIMYVAMSALLLTSCYEDKGNYDYRFDSMNEVDISNVSYQPEAYDGLSGKVIEVQMPLAEDKVQRVEAKLSQTLADNYDNLDFAWYTAYTATKRDPMTGREVTETVRDTLRTNGYVDLNFPANTDRNYSVIMEVKDRTTDLDYYAKLNVKTHGIIIVRGKPCAHRGQHRDIQRIQVSALARRPVLHRQVGTVLYRAGRVG